MAVSMLVGNFNEKYEVCHKSQNQMWERKGFLTRWNSSSLYILILATQHYLRLMSIMLTADYGPRRELQWPIAQDYVCSLSCAAPGLYVPFTWVWRGTLITTNFETFASFHRLSVLQPVSITQRKFPLFRHHRVRWQSRISFTRSQI